MIRAMPEEEFFVSGHRACAGCGATILLRHITKAAGKDTIIVNATGCMEVVSTPYPETSWRLPWIHGAFQNNSAIASGIAEALKIQGKKTKVICIGGDGATFDIGFGTLSGALERGHDFLYICYDNEAYQNTGVQRSGATPKYANTTTSPAEKKVHGKTELKKPLPLIIAAHRAPYVATASVSHIPDLYAKIKKALSIEGPKYLQIFATCPTGWYSDISKSIEIPRMAVQARVYPLYEIVNGKLKFTVEVNNPIPVKDYLKTQGRFKHLTEEEIAEIQKNVDSEWNKLKTLEKLEGIF
ncbi:MAG: pyruvate synthase subunit PorB [archaeon]